MYLSQLAYNEHIEKELYESIVLSKADATTPLIPARLLLTHPPTQSRGMSETQMNNFGCNLWCNNYPHR